MRRLLNRAFVIATFLAWLPSEGEEVVPLSGSERIRSFARYGFPAEFGGSKNMIWRTAGATGKSSPVLTKLHIYVVGYEKGKFYTQCIDRKSGKAALGAVSGSFAARRCEQAE